MTAPGKQRLERQEPNKGASHSRSPRAVSMSRLTMSLSKKRKISGLSGLELDLALTQLRKLRSSVIVEEVPESDPTPADTFTDQLDSMIATLESRTNSSLVQPFSHRFCNTSLLVVALFLRCRMTQLWKGSTSSERACSTSIQRAHFVMQLSPLELSALTNCGQTITCTNISPSSPAPSRIKFVFTPSRRALFCSL